jgi:hypothetical protein
MKKVLVFQAVTTMLLLFAVTYSASGFDSSGLGDPRCFEYSINDFAFKGGSSKPDGKGGFNFEYHFEAWVWQGDPHSCDVKPYDHSDCTITGVWDEPSKTARETITYMKPWNGIAKSESVVKCDKDPWQDKTYKECAIISNYGTSAEVQHNYPVSAFRIKPNIKTLVGSTTAPGSGDTFHLPDDKTKPVFTKAPGVEGKESLISQQVAIAPEYCAQYEPALITSVKAGSTITVPVKVTNCGRKGWNTGAASSLSNVFLSYHTMTGSAPAGVDGLMTDAGSVPAGTFVTIKARFQAPSKPGSYVLKWDMIQQPSLWFSSKGVAVKDQMMTVK